MKKANGLEIIVRLDIEADELAKVLPELQGSSFRRLFLGFSAPEPTRKLERAFTLLLAEKCDENQSIPLLSTVLHPNSISSIPFCDGEEMDDEHSFTPKNEREWKVAQFAIASFNQWLGTACGTAHICESYKRAGGKIQVIEYPK